MLVLHYMLGIEVEARIMTMLITWKTVILGCACCVMVSCAGRDADSPEDSAEKVRLEELYARHGEYMEVQLKKRFSMIGTDLRTVNELVEYVESNKEFFRDRVLENFFIAEKVLSSSDLAKKHSKRLDTIDMETRKKVWLEILSPSSPDSANPE